MPIYGFGAWQDEMLVGITHVVLHPNTWNTTECCYLEDLYVSDAVRGQGVGRALIEQVYEFANEEKLQPCLLDDARRQCDGTQSL